MLKNGVYIKKLKIPTYRTTLWVVVADHLPVAIDTVEDVIDHKIDDGDIGRTSVALTYAYTREDGKRHILIFLKPRPKAGTIAHEALHAIHFVYLWHGVRPSYSNDEAQAYFLDWMVETCYGALRAYRREKKKGG
jgi:hypothetical protein